MHCRSSRRNTYPKVISKSGIRPESTKQMITIDLTVPYESRMEAAQIYKTEKYADLASILKSEGYQVKVLAAEIWS